MYLLLVVCGSPPGVSSYGKCTLKYLGDGNAFASRFAFNLIISAPTEDLRPSNHGTASSKLTPLPSLRKSLSICLNQLDPDLR